MNLTEIKTPITILLADDDMDDRHLFEEALKGISIETQLKTVTNGEELMDYLSKKPINLPDIIFLDLSMPRKTGFECLHEIKEDENLKGLHVIVFTTSFIRGYQFELELTNTLSGMGAEDYIRKPEGFEQLKLTLNEALNRAIKKIRLKKSGESNTVNTKKIPDIDLKQLNILLADDDADDRLFFKEALSGYPLSTNLTTVPDGEHLMQLLINEQYELPDVIFLDLNMPRKNGFECLSEIKINSKLNKVSVVVFSTSFEQEVVNELYQNGAQYFIRKPSEFSQLKKIIQQTLALILHGNNSQPAKENFVIKLQVA